MINWILIVIGVVLTHALVLTLQFHRRAKGYLLRATNLIWLYLCLIVFLETAIAGAFVELGSRLIQFRPSSLAFIVGVLAALLPRGFEHLVLYRNFEEKAMNLLSRMLRKLNLAAGHKFSGAVRTRIEQDVFDWQSGSEEHFGLNPAEFRQRIRQVYNRHVVEVATLRRDPALLLRDVGFSPYGHLYILVEHLGRRKLIKELKTASFDWSGAERRRVRGTIADRFQPGKAGRLYDNKDLIESIRKGQSSVSRPPFNAEYLLYLLLRKDERDVVIGDLVEEYSVVFGRFDKRYANVWFYKQVIGSLFPLIRRALLRIVALVWLGRILRRLIS